MYHLFMRNLSMSAMYHLFLRNLTAVLFALYALRALIHLSMWRR
jgi:hypothetical protein